MQQKIIVFIISSVLTGLIGFYVFFALEKGETEYMLEKVSYDHPVQSDLFEISIPESPFKVNQENLKVIEKQIQHGDSFYSIMRSFNVDRQKINLINKQISQKVDLQNFQKGDPYKMYLAPDGKAVKLDYPIDAYRLLRLDFKRGTSRVIEPPVELVEKHIVGGIYGSLIGSLKKAGAPEDLADKVVTIFAWQIDFRNLQAGDLFDIYYQEKSVNKKVVGSDNILAVKLTHNSRDSYGYYYQNDAIVGYFDRAGTNLSHGPVNGAIITSLFSQRRFHPVRRTYRAHKGMDFMADEGTPVMALEGGKIIAAKYHYGNGNYIKIQHSKDLMTQYLHLSEIDSAISIGVTVDAHQVIGRVGSTGLSSGPHLCLRVWYKGVQRDPLNHQFSSQPSLSAQERISFDSSILSYFGGKD
jgi:murein DD-endopeptidase MepM/ murein hydrolase activator NlpD